MSSLNHMQDGSTVRSLSRFPTLAAAANRRLGRGDSFPPISTGRCAGPLSLRPLLRRKEEGGTPFLHSVVRFWICRSWCVVGVVGAAPGRINLPQPHSHTGGVFHGGVSELMASCLCRSLRSTALGFMDGVDDAAAATPSGVSFLLLCPR